MVEKSKMSNSHLGTRHTGWWPSCFKRSNQGFTTFSNPTGDRLWWTQCAWTRTINHPFWGFPIFRNHESWTTAKSSLILVVSCEMWLDYFIGCTALVVASGDWSANSPVCCSATSKSPALHGVGVARGLVAVRSALSWAACCHLRQTMRLCGRSLVRNGYNLIPKVDQEPIMNQFWFRFSWLLCMAEITAIRAWFISFGYVPKLEVRFLIRKDLDWSVCAYVTAMGDPSLYPHIWCPITSYHQISPAIHG